MTVARQTDQTITTNMRATAKSTYEVLRSMGFSKERAFVVAKKTLERKSATRSATRKG